ncbi:hypothetical protein MP228_010626 [Amoeboaphelidium protococcarum]|nr:hypothetical protein MP228_010626 [Amoeboaphelidium protococcarum]
MQNQFTTKSCSCNVNSISLQKESRVAICSGSRLERRPLLLDIGRNRHRTPHPGAFPYLVGSPQLADRQTKPTVTKPNPEALDAVFKGEHQASGMPLRVGAYLHEQPVQRAKGQSHRQRCLRRVPNRLRGSEQQYLPTDQSIRGTYLPGYGQFNILQHEYHSEQRCSAIIRCGEANSRGLDQSACSLNSHFAVIISRSPESNCTNNTPSQSAAYRAIKDSQRIRQNTEEFKSDCYSYGQYELW